MIETTFDSGLRIRIKPSGLGRFFGVGFLCVWLCGWLMGEIFAGAVLLKLVRDVWVDGLSGPGALGVGAFLLVWLTFWTFGGFAAIQEVLRSLWAEDVLQVDGGSLHVRRSIGPFRKHLPIALDSIRAFRLQTGTSRLVADTDERTVELSQLGHLGDREAALKQLRDHLDIHAEEPALPEGLPQGWAEQRDEEGFLLLVPDPAVRARQVIFSACLTLPLALLTLWLVRLTLNGSPLHVGAAVSAAATGALGFTTVWLYRGRKEWRIEPNRLTLRRRFGQHRTDLFEAVGLEFDVEADSDGDDWFELRAIAAGQGPRNRFGRNERTRLIHRSVHEPDTPLRIGRWLSAQSGIPLDDRR